MPKCPKCQKEVYFDQPQQIKLYLSEFMRPEEGRFLRDTLSFIPLSNTTPNNVLKLICTERVTSLGKDWHRPCLKCAKCNKTLSPGSHAEHEGNPYCHSPCYGVMFGPKGFGRGGTESHSYK